MSATIRQLHRELVALAEPLGLVDGATFSAYELAQDEQHQQRTFKHDVVRRYKLDTVQHHALVINFEDNNGNYNGMVLLGNLRRAIAMFKSGEQLFDICDGCDTCQSHTESPQTNQ